MPELIQVPERPDALTEVPTYRYWGDRKPPKNRAEMFSSTVAPRAAAEDEETDADETPAKVATLRMYGPIDSWGGWWGISARDVSEALDAAGDVDEVRVRINSPGGDAWEGMAIMNMLRAHPAKVVAVVDGIAASAASYIAVGCDETVMSPGTQMMIHDASTFAYGPAAIMRKAATFLDSVSNAIASVYAEVAGGSDADWRALMVETTWYTAAEAVESGLADRVAVVPDAGSTDTAGEEAPQLDEDVEDHFDLSMYPRAGRSKSPAPPIPPAASAAGSVNTQEGSTAVANFSDEQLTQMRKDLGLPADADEATIVAALSEVVAEQAEEPPSNSTIPEGHIVVPEARLKDLETSAQAGVQAAEQLRVQERETFLNSNRTKFAPANRDAWAKEYDRDPKGTREHFEKAPVLVPTDELGDAQGADPTSDDALYASVFGDEKKAV